MTGLHGTPPQRRSIRDIRLERALARAHRLAGDLARASDSAGDLALASDFARDFARELADALDRDLTFARIGGVAHANARNLGRALVRASDRTSDLVSDLVRARERASGLPVDRARDLAAVLALSEDLIRALDRARDRAIAPAGQEGVGGGSAVGQTAVRVAPTAKRLAGAAARLLPAGDRARFAEEFGSELWEIARAGGRRRRQLMYAARQVGSAWRLRRALRVPRRQGAVP